MQHLDEILKIGKSHSDMKGLDFVDEQVTPLSLSQLIRATIVDVNPYHVSSSKDMSVSCLCLLLMMLTLVNFTIFLILLLRVVILKLIKTYWCMLKSY